MYLATRYVLSYCSTYCTDLVAAIYLPEKGCHSHRLEENGSPLFVPEVTALFCSMIEKILLKKHNRVYQPSATEFTTSHVLGISSRDWLDDLIDRNAGLKSEVDANLNRGDMSLSLDRARNTPPL